MRSLLMAAVILAVPLFSRADSTAPHVEMKTPVGYQTLTGKVYISAVASDNLAVDRVEFYLDGIADGKKPMAVIRTAPYRFGWYSSAVSPGVHTIGAAAYDAAGNRDFQYVLVFVSASGTITQCHVFPVKVVNNALGTVSGGLHGAPPNGGIGSASWSTASDQTDIFYIPTGGAPRVGGFYTIAASIYSYQGEHVDNVSCKADVPAALNGCPMLPISARMTIGLDRSGKPRCTMVSK